MSITLINAMLAGAALTATIRASGAFRLRTLVTSYAISALAIGLFVVGLGMMRNEPHLFWLAAASVILKAGIIPAVIVRAAERAGVAMRLSSSLRPATTYFTTFVLIAAVTFAAFHSPFAAGADPAYFLIVGVSMVAIGFMMLIVRRDLISQVVGFLIMENGVAVFSFAVVRDLPFLVEIGILTTLTLGIVLMGTVSKHVHELYGTENTQAMRDLID